MAAPPPDSPPDPAIVELYQTPPGGFVAARDALVRSLRQAGERDAAKEVAARRRPSSAAWGANLLAGNRPALIDAVFEAAARWRQASSAGDQEETRAAQADLRTVTGDAVDAATDLMSERGHPARADDAEALRSTLLAAAIDDELAGVLRSGTLEAAVLASGFGGVAVSPGGATAPARPRPKARAGGVAGRSAGRRTPATSAAAASDRSDGGQDEPEATAAAARQAALAAEADRAELVAERDRLVDDADRAEKRAIELAAEADRAEQAAAAARQVAQDAREAADGALEAAVAARNAVDEAES